MPFLLRAEALGDGEIGHDRAVVNAVLAHLGAHLASVGERLGTVGEYLVHLLARLKPLLLGIAHAVGVVEVLAGGEAEQMVVGFGRLLILKVAVVGADHLDAVLGGQFEDHLVGLLLHGECLAVGHDVGVFDLVALYLEVVVVAEHAPVPLDSLSRAVDVPAQYLVGHLAGDAGRGDYQTLVIFLEVGPVGARLVVEAVHPGAGDELDEVLVAPHVLGQHDEVIARGVAGLLELVLLAPAGHIHLAAEDGHEVYHPLLLLHVGGQLGALLLVGQALHLLLHVLELAARLALERGDIVGKLLDAHHIAVVGDGHAAHAVGYGLVYDIRYLALPVQERILCVDVQVYEVLH